MVIAQPESNHFGRLCFNPILAKKVVITSTGQTIHQMRPKKIAIKTIAGHQYDQTMRFQRFVLRNCNKNSASDEYDINPVTIRIINTARETYLNETGK